MDVLHTATICNCYNTCEESSAIPKPQASGSTPPCIIHSANWTTYQYRISSFGWILSLQNLCQLSSNRLWPCTYSQLMKDIKYSIMFLGSKQRLNQKLLTCDCHFSYLIWAHNAPSKRLRITKIEKKNHQVVSWSTSLQIKELHDIVISRLQLLCVCRLSTWQR